MWTKISTAKMSNFVAYTTKKGLIVGYDNTNQYFDNFDLIASISKNLGITEVLLRNLRNRAFHCESIYKLNDENKPRLIATFENDESSLCVD